MASFLLTGTLDGKEDITNWNEQDVNILGYDALENGVNGTNVSEQLTTSISRYTEN